MTDGGSMPSLCWLPTGVCGVRKRWRMNGARLSASRSLSGVTDAVLCGGRGGGGGMAIRLRTASASGRGECSAELMESPGAMPSSSWAQCPSSVIASTPSLSSGRLVYNWHQKQPRRPSSAPTADVRRSDAPHRVGVRDPEPPLRAVRQFAFGHGTPMRAQVVVVIRRQFGSGGRVGRDGTTGRIAASVYICLCRQRPLHSTFSGHRCILHSVP